MADSRRRDPSCLSRAMNVTEVRRESSSFHSGDVGLSRRSSVSLSQEAASQALEDLENEIVARAGDDGYSRSSSMRFEINDLHLMEHQAGIVPIDLVILSNTSDAPSLNTASGTSPLTAEIISSFNSRQNTCSKSETPKTSGTSVDNQNSFPWLLEYLSCLFHLATFGILGVLTRYLLQKLFGPKVAHITGDGTPLYLDLPSNIVGSLLMGWFGVVFKATITSLSDLLAIGLTTGFLGSLTTFSGWNQKMLDLAADGKWVISFVGYIIGMALVYFSIGFGVSTAKGFRWFLLRLGMKNSVDWKVAGYKRQLYALFAFLLMLGLLWATSGVLLKNNLDDDNSVAQLWLGCLVGPAGVWFRWFLARLNGRGLGRKKAMKWVPFGTLIANVFAACLMAALATTKKAVNTKRSNIIVNGFQFGFLGCLSTVSTFVAEVYAMAQSKCPWRAYVYVMLTVIPSFVLGILIYCVPVWTKGYK